MALGRAAYKSRTHSSAGERSLHTGEVQGSIPCASTRRAQDNKDLAPTAECRRFVCTIGGAAGGARQVSRVQFLRRALPLPRSGSRVRAPSPAPNLHGFRVTYEGQLHCAFPECESGERLGERQTPCRYLFRLTGEPISKPLDMHSSERLLDL
jgi:hypothetical protein